MNESDVQTILDAINNLRDDLKHDLRDIERKLDTVEFEVQQIKNQST